MKAYVNSYDVYYCRCFFRSQNSYCGFFWNQIGRTYLRVQVCKVVYIKITLGIQLCRFGRKWTTKTLWCLLMSKLHTCDRGDKKNWGEFVSFPRETNVMIFFINCAWWYTMKFSTLKYNWKTIWILLNL